MNTTTLRALACAALLAGCGQPVQISDVQATPSPDIVTVVTVSWTTDTASTGYVAYGPDGDLSLSTGLSASGTEHSVALVGLSPDTAYSYQVVVPGEEESLSKTEELTTELLPNWLPAMASDGAAQSGYYMAVPLLSSGGDPVPAILSASGEFLWYYQEESALEMYRVRLSVDGQSVLYNLSDVSLEPTEEAMLVRRSLDGQEVEEISVPGLAHDFIEMDDGTIGAIAVDLRDGVRGDQIIEIAPDGSQQSVWSAFDCFDPAEVEGDLYGLGWTFSNALDYLPDEDAYLVGMYGFGSIVKIDRATGSCDWVVGETAATMTPDPAFARQHQFELLDDGGLLVFDNAGGGINGRIVEYDLDPGAGTATERWSYSADVSAIVLGDVHRFDDGETLVTWSYAGQLDHLDAQGERQSQINLDVGNVFGFNTIMDTLYR